MWHLRQSFLRMTAVLVPKLRLQQFRIRVRKRHSKKVARCSACLLNPISSAISCPHNCAGGPDNRSVIGIRERNSKIESKWSC